jgi:hypothetical protein
MVGYSFNTEEVLYSMPYSLPTLESGSTFLCPYVIIHHTAENSGLTIVTKPRRWLQRQWETFITMTPEERKLVEGSMNSQAHDATPKGEPATSSEQ